MPPFAFVACGEQGKVSKDDDWLVRSHCMLGKNARARRGTRQRNQKERVQAPSKRSATSRRIPITTQIYDFVLHIPKTLEADDTSFLPGSVDRQSWYFLRQLSHYQDKLYPLDSYIDQNDCIAELSPDDEGALTTALMTASAHNDFVSHHGPTAHTRKLIANTISYLNSLLDKDDACSRSSAICMILHLTAVAMLCGEYNAAFTHFYGISEVLRLYKAQEASHEDWEVPTNFHYDMVIFKVERLAFCLYYITGRNGPFFSEAPSWESVDIGPPLPYKEVLTGSPKLDSIFSDFRSLCHVVQQRSAKRLKVEAEYFHKAMHSLQARVLALSPGQGTPFAECLRLAITAAITSQTQMPMRQLEHPYLNRQFRQYLPLLECPVEQRNRDAVLWIVMAAFAVTFDPEEEDEPWAEALFRDVAGDTGNWEAARLRVESVTWFPRYIDVQNEKVFKTLRRRWPLQEQTPLQEVH